jgi:hypothetical protein
VSPHEKKKSKATAASTTRFLSGVTRSFKSHVVDLAEHEESANKAKAMVVKIKKPTKADYKNMPKNMCRIDLYSLLRTKEAPGWY